MAVLLLCSYQKMLILIFTRSPTADPRHSRESTKRHLKSGVISCTFSRLFRNKMPITKFVTNKIGLLWCHSLFELRLLEVEMNLGGISLTRLSYYYVAAILFVFSSNFIFAKLSPSPGSNWAEAGSIPSFSGRPAGRPSGIVLSRPSMTLTSKAKLLISMVRL